MTTIVGVIGALLAAVGVVATALIGRRNAQSETVQRDSAVAMAAWQELLVPYREEVGDLRTRVDHLEAEVKATRSRLVRATDYIRALIRTMHAHDIDPPPPPEDLDL